MASCKKISIDFHGVITAAPEFFAKLMRLWHKQGTEIYVVSGGPREYIESYMAEHKIPYNELWCIFDYFNARKKVEVAADGSFHIDDVLWDSAKGKYCAREQIGLHIDDSLIYGKYFTTPYVRFDPKNRGFEIGGKLLSIDEDTQKIAEILSATFCKKIKDTVWDK